MPPRFPEEPNVPPSVGEILTTYSLNNNGDKDVLLAILGAKAAEDKRIAALAGLNEQCIAYAMMKNRFHLEQTSTSAAPRHDITGPTTPPDSHPLSEMRSVVNSMDSPAPLPTPLSPQQSPLTYPPIINPNSPRYDPTEPPFGGRGAYLSPSPQPRERQEKPQSRSIRLPPLRAIAPPPPLPSPSTPTPRISSGPRKGDHMYSHATISISPLTRE